MLKREQNVPRRSDKLELRSRRLFEGRRRAAVAALLTGWAWLGGDRRRPQRGSPPSGLTLGHRRRQTAL